jgi:hypothetical protein
MNSKNIVTRAATIYFQGELQLAQLSIGSVSNLDIGVTSGVLDFCQLMPIRGKNPLSSGFGHTLIKDRAGR